MGSRGVQTALCWTRTAVGAGMWLAPGRSARLFGLGPALDQADPALVGRLFGVRDIALAQALRHPDPQLRRQALRLGVAVDTVDVVASLVAALRGGRRSGLVGVGAGALLFACTGLVALRDAER